jgi:hypothetical protein
MVQKEHLRRPCQLPRTLRVLRIGDDDAYVGLLVGTRGDHFLDGGVPGLPAGSGLNEGGVATAIGVADGFLQNCFVPLKTVDLRTWLKPPMLR